MHLARHLWQQPTCLLILGWVFSASICFAAETTGTARTQERLLFSMYSLAQPQLSQAREDGLTAIGPYYGKRDLDKELGYAAAAKLPLIYTVGNRLDFDAPESIDMDQELAELAQSIAKASQHPEIIVWSLANEELRYWRPKEMEWLRRATRVIRENDPQNRPIMMYQPNHRSAEALLETSKHLDYVAKGSYANYVKKKNNRTWIRWSTEQAQAAAEATGGTPVALLWMARDQKSAEDVASIAKWTRHDVYLSLISGAKGIIVFSGWNRRRNFRTHFELFYNGYAAAANELNGNLDLGRIFLEGSEENNIALETMAGPVLQEFEYRDNLYSYPTVSWAEYSMDGKKYLFVVNSAESAVQAKIDGLPDGRPVFDVFSGQQLTSTDSILLERLQVMALTW